MIRTGVMEVYVSDIRQVFLKPCERFQESLYCMSWPQIVSDHLAFLGVDNTIHTGPKATNKIKI